MSDLLPVAEQMTVSRVFDAEDLSIDQRRSPAGTIRLHQLTVASLAELAAKLDEVGPHDADLVLALPSRALVLGQPEELIKRAQLVGGMCVAASAVPMASPALAVRLKRETEKAGSPVTRCQCFPHAFVGPAAQCRSLLADLPEGDTDADRLTAAVLGGRHDLALDTVSFFFHLLDGTGTDVTIVAGRAHVCGKQPLVLIDPSAEGQALASVETDLADRGAGDLARLLRYDGAVASGDRVTRAAGDVRVAQLWAPSFCATVLRAAEVAGLWTNHVVDASTARVEVWLADLIPRLSTHLEADLDRRIWPLLSKGQPVERMRVIAAMVIREQVGASAQNTVDLRNPADVSGSVRLNDGYTGGTLQLPHQGWHDANVPVGALTLWPSDASHPYHVTPVTSGVKYTLHLRFRMADS